MARREAFYVGPSGSVVYGSSPSDYDDAVRNMALQTTDPFQNFTYRMLDGLGSAADVAEVSQNSSGLRQMFNNLSRRAGHAWGSAKNRVRNFLGGGGGGGASGGPTVSPNPNTGTLVPIHNSSAIPNMPHAPQAPSAPMFSWNKGSGLQAFGKNVGKFANFANAGIQGAQAIGNIYDLANEGYETDDILDDIRLAAMNNPYYQYDLTDAELKLLRDINRGRADTSAGLGDVNWLNALGDTAVGVTTGAVGGIPGMIIGGIGGLGNSILGDLSSEQDATNAELEQLLASLEASKRNYKQMRGQRAYANFM